MSASVSPTAYGDVSEPATLRIERVLPGPIERVWSYLVDSDLRRQWLASGDLKQEAGSRYEFTWHNDALSDPPGKRPDGFDEKHSMSGKVLEVDAPRKLVISWGTASEVMFELEPAGKNVLLKLTHRKLPDRNSSLNVSAGWHTHLDALVAKLNGERVGPFWEQWLRLKAEYDKRIPN